MKGVVARKTVLPGQSKEIEKVPERGKNIFRISRKSTDTPKTESALLCKSKEAQGKRLSLTTFFGKSKKTEERSEKRTTLIKETDDMQEALEKKRTFESSKKPEEMSPKRISLFEYSKKKEESSEKRTGSESSKEMEETCEQRTSLFGKTKKIDERSASTEENEEIPKRRKKVFGHLDEKDEHKKRVSLESREKAEGITETRENSNKSANGEKKSWRKSWFSTQHNETQTMTMTEKELNLSLKTESIEPVKRKVRPRSQEMEQNTEKISDVCEKSKAIEERAVKKRSSFSLTKKASERGLDASRSRRSWDPRVYIRRVRTFLRTTLTIIFISIISCWRRTHAILKSTEVRLLRSLKTSFSFMIDVMPKKMVKSFMVYSCHVLPDLRNRSAVLYVLNWAPARLTKKIASAYLRKVPMCLMSWHANLLLKASPIRKIARNLAQVLRLPRMLLETAFMGAASVMKILSRAMTFPGGHKPELARRQSSLSSWKFRSRTNSAGSDQE